ncbi:Mobile element protein [Luteococcus japonicus LSP_Lj1]|uniref:Mobile element protein n=1 Tax=Luteococcus japonicus LSP_Lj1 TaxID=1255658 RepID=A0A1R4IT24_9ACTN|nr:Mobile element protein [Luteococcus japonicus LSP_Lj1]
MLQRPIEPAVYTSKAYAKLCKGLVVTQSMGPVGTSADNSLAESFNATLKRELLAAQATFAGPELCRRQVFRWLVRYNTRRRHSWFGHLSPNTHEARRTTTLAGAA